MKPRTLELKSINGALITFRRRDDNTIQIGTLLPPSSRTLDADAQKQLARFLLETLDVAISEELQPPQPKLKPGQLVQHIQSHRVAIVQEVRKTGRDSEYTIVDVLAYDPPDQVSQATWSPTYIKVLVDNVFDVGETETVEQPKLDWKYDIDDVVLTMSGRYGKIVGRRFSDGQRDTHTGTPMYRIRFGPADEGELSHVGIYKKVGRSII